MFLLVSMQRSAKTWVLVDTDVRRDLPLKVPKHLCTPVPFQPGQHWYTGAGLQVPVYFFFMPQRTLQRESEVSKLFSRILLKWQNLRNDFLHKFGYFYSYAKEMKSNLQP